MLRKFQIVECIDDSISPGARWYDGQIFKGQKYTIREVGITHRGAPGVRLFETELSGLRGNITGLPYCDSFYRADRFRPLTNTKTEISFTTGAPKDSKRWDNRHKKRERV
jgi:hypothetical protein